MIECLQGTQLQEIETVLLYESIFAISSNSKILNSHNNKAFVLPKSSEWPGQGGIVSYTLI
jgi:hypothetical protein